MTFKYLQSRLDKLPRIVWDLDTMEDNQAPSIKIWTDDRGNQTVCLSSEQGNFGCFEYLGDSDYMVDLKPELHEWAKQYGWVWEAQYQGTYFLTQA